MSRFKSALLALITSICALAVLPVTPASAAGLAPSQARIWHVLVGGHEFGTSWWGATRTTRQFRPKGTTQE